MFDGKAVGPKRVVSHAGAKKATFISTQDAKKLREQREKDRKKLQGTHV
jgi:hypothetical protein